MKFDISFDKGFLTYKNGPGPVWVCPHSGPALEVPTSRDENSDTVASLCWLKTGGTLVISTLPRKPLYGVDYNREVPPKSTAIGIWSDFADDKFYGRLERYRKKYAWVSPNKIDYSQRLKLYNEFWKKIKRLGNITVFVHRKFCRVKNFPSVMDIITYEGAGVNKEVVKTIVEKINEKYQPFLKDIEKNYKFNILLEHERIIDRTKELFGEFSMDKIKIEYRKNLLQDLAVIKKYAEKEKIKKLEKEFNEKTYLSALKSAMKTKTQPIVTVESIFKGDPAITKKKPMFLKGHIVMEVESNAFMNYWYPRETAQILIDLLDSLVSVDMYKREGMKQRHIEEYLRVKEDR